MLSEKYLRNQCKTTIQEGTFGLLRKTDIPRGLNRGWTI